MPEPLPDLEPQEQELQQQEEQWLPEPTDWFSARVTKVTRGHSFAELSNGDPVFIFPGKVVPSATGHVCLALDDEVAVRIEWVNGQSYWQALEVVKETQDKHPERMKGTVTTWLDNGQCGFAKLACSCSFFAKTRDVMFLDKNDPVIAGDIRRDPRHSGKFIITFVETILEEQMKNRFEIDQQEAAAAAQTAANLAIFNRWYEKHPEVPRNAEGGVAESVLRLFQEYMDFTDALTASDFDFAYSNLQKQIMLRRVPTPAEVKAELIDEICDLLKSPDGTGRGGKYSDFNIKAVRQQMSYWDIAKLQARRDEIVREQEMTKKSVQELKQIVSDARRDDRPYPGYPILPKQIVRPGTVRAVPLDSAYIRNLSSYELRRLCLIYSQAQVNARLQGIA